MMGNPHDAEEVAQDAFVSAFKARDRFRGESQATTWLYRITVNAALMRLRRDKRRREMTVSEDARPDAPSSDLAELPGPAALNSELGDKLAAAVDDLPDDLRTAVVLRDIQGLSNSEAADILGVSIPALKARLHQGPGGYTRKAKRIRPADLGLGPVNTKSTPSGGPRCHFSNPRCHTSSPTCHTSSPR